MKVWIIWGGGGGGRQILNLKIVTIQQKVEKSRVYSCEFDWNRANTIFLQTEHLNYNNLPISAKVESFEGVKTNMFEKGLPHLRRREISEFIIRSNMGRFSIHSDQIKKDEDTYETLWNYMVMVCFLSILTILSIISNCPKTICSSPALRICSSSSLSSASVPTACTNELTPGQVFVGFFWMIRLDLRKWLIQQLVGQIRYRKIDTIDEWIIFGLKKMIAAQA